MNQLNMVATILVISLIKSGTQRWRPIDKLAGTGATNQHYPID